MFFRGKRQLRIPTFYIYLLDVKVISWLKMSAEYLVFLDFQQQGV